METARKVLTCLLVAFALVSLGFSLGKHSVSRSGNSSGNIGSNLMDKDHNDKDKIGKGEPSNAAGMELSMKSKKAYSNDYLAVYYLHSSFRCSTCNTIEKYTRELLDTRYGPQLSRGEIVWHEVDFQVQEDLASQFQVVASCVVVARIRADKVISFSRLDDVWTHVEDRAAFEAYVSGAIDRESVALTREGKSGK
ncbi:MAG: hypothetical protein CVV64_14070 [Candidatus Wallbacteria bacterium HGW-Wallbacteria-1]|jgi:hypothetical protein|uniref:Uncharacterized protein n=1 Tax=Candidatus Wallbacteria bacterium HGW-Wallbacteria-1 TaxID=2013854 RepID=A0A2N1PMG1_9BACT|nr:MAG: hypothetical protein CVV64_14070 [Candidatus Wallbacteria bacterium HGW-Wallbacteria-1]